MNATLQNPNSAKEGLELEADLFVADDTGVLLWAATQAGLVCPRAYSSRDGFQAAVDASARRGWPVHLRPSGGGAVPQGPGIANIALAFHAPQDFTIEDGYRLLTDVLKTALPGGHRLAAGDTPGSFCDGVWNLSVDGQKLVGTAQKWRPKRGGKPRVLAHGMIITTDAFQPGAEAVDAFHRDLGLTSVRTDAHTSLQSGLGINALPAEALRDAALALIAQRTQ